MKVNEMNVGQIGYLNINTQNVENDPSSYYRNVEVKVICRENAIWNDGIRTGKKYLEIVRTE